MVAIYYPHSCTHSHSHLLFTLFRAIISTPTTLYNSRLTLHGTPAHSHLLFSLSLLSHKLHSRLHFTLSHKLHSRLHFTLSHKLHSLHYATLIYTTILSSTLRYSI